MGKLEVMRRVECLSDSVTLHLGDCLELAGPFDAAVVSDPPYGMNWNTDSTRFTANAQHKRGKGRDDWKPIANDAAPFDPTPWLDFPECVLFGANHFAQRVPIGTTLMWIKKAPHLFGTFLSDAEMAWKKGGHGIYVYYEQFPPASRIFENDGKQVAHPTQKPIGLMKWCIERTKSKTIFDPYMGSGTTGVAAVQLGRGFIGVEQDERYFDIACRRVSNALKQPDLFVASPAVKTDNAQASLL